MGWTRTQVPFCLALVALLAAGGMARADSIGDLLPIAIPGFAASPGVTARSRLHPEYLPRPVTPATAVPDFEVFPSLTVGGGVDTAPGAGQPSTAFGLLRPALRAVDRRLGLGAYLGAGLQRYARDPAADANDVTAAVGLAIPFGPDRLTLAAAHVTRGESALGLGADGDIAPLTVGANDGRIALRLGFGGFDATERIAASAETLRARGTVPAGFGRRTALRTETELATAGAAALRGLILLRAGTTHYAGAVAGSGFVDTTSIGLLAGFVTDAGALWRLRVAGGAERERYAAGGAAAGVTPVYDVTLGWTPDPLIALDLRIARSAGSDTGLGAPGTAVTTERLGLAEAFRRNLRLTAAIAARQGKVAGHGAAEMDVAAGARWHLSRALALVPAARLAFRHDLDGAAAREARLTVSLLWTP